jgi:hypothetical protein
MESLPFMILFLPGEFEQSKNKRDGERLHRRGPPAALEPVMVSVIIESRNEGEALALTLAALVPGALEGVIGDVVVLADAIDEETRLVADAAGCTRVTKGVAEAIAATRSDWLLLLEPGARPTGNWIEAIGAHVANETRPARFRLSGSWFSRLASMLRRGRNAPLAAGLLLPKAEIRQAAAKARTLADLARGQRPVSLPSAIAPAPRRASGARRAGA